MILSVHIQLLLCTDLVFGTYVLISYLLYTTHSTHCTQSTHSIQSARSIHGMHATHTHTHCIQMLRYSVLSTMYLLKFKLKNSLYIVLTKIQISRYIVLVSLNKLKYLNLNSNSNIQVHCTYLLPCLGLCCLLHSTHNMQVKNILID